MSDAPAPAAPAAGGNNKMMFIMMGVMLVVMLGGMGGMYVLLSKKTDAAAATAGGEHGEEGGENGKEDEHEKEEPKEAAKYVAFDPPFVVNFPAGSSVKFLQASMQVMTRDELLHKSIETNSPAIRDALLSLLGQQTPEKLATPEGKDELRAQALEAVRTVMKGEGAEPEKIEGVYFTSFVMQ